MSEPIQDTPPGDAFESRSLSQEMFDMLDDAYRRAYIVGDEPPVAIALQTLELFVSASCLLITAEPGYDLEAGPSGPQHGIEAARWYLVAIPDDELPAVVEFQTRDELVVDLTERLRAESSGGLAKCTFYVLVGQRVHFSTGPYRYLMLPDGLPIPLFSPPNAETLTADEAGSVALQL